MSVSNGVVADDALSANRPAVNSPGYDSVPQALPGVGHRLWLDRLSLLTCVGLCCAGGWFLAAQSGKAMALNNEIYQTQQQLEQLAATNASDTAAVDQLTRPARILNIALNQLHMHYESPLTIRTSATVGAQSQGW